MAQRQYFNSGPMGYQTPQNRFGAPAGNSYALSTRAESIPQGNYLPPGYREPTPPSFEDSQRGIQNDRNAFTENLRQQRATQNAVNNKVIAPAPTSYLMTGSGKNAATYPLGGSPSYGGQATAPGVSAPYGMGPTMKPPAIPQGKVVSEQKYIENPNYQPPPTANVYGTEVPTGWGAGDKYTLARTSRVEYPPAPQMAPATTQPSAEPQMSQGPVGPDGKTDYQRNREYGDTHKGGGHIQVTEQQAREIFKQMHASQPQMDPEALHSAFIGHLAERYGVDAGAARQMLTGWTKADNVQNAPNGQMYAPPTVSQAPAMPLSMFGPSSGLDPSQKYNVGAPVVPGGGAMAYGRQATAGPSFAPPATVTPGAAIPHPGSTVITPKNFPQISDSLRTSQPNPAKKPTVQPSQAAQPQQAQGQVPQGASHNGDGSITFNGIKYIRGTQNGQAGWQRAG